MSGASSDDVYKPTLWWFRLLDFVDVDQRGRTTCDNMESVSIMRSVLQHLHLNVVSKISLKQKMGAKPPKPCICST